MASEPFVAAMEELDIACKYHEETTRLAEELSEDLNDWNIHEVQLQTSEMTEFFSRGTILGAITEEGQVMGCVTRSSNINSILVSDSDGKLFNIMDGQIIATAVGNFEHAKVAARYLMDAVRNNIPIEGVIDPFSYIAQRLVTHLESEDIHHDLDLKILFGGIIKRHNAHSCLELCRVDIVPEDGQRPFIQYLTKCKWKLTAAGTGAEIALKSMKSHHYGPSMSLQEAGDLATIALVTAALYDKFSGGRIQVYLLTNGGGIHVYDECALDAYRKVYRSIDNTPFWYVLVPRAEDGCDHLQSYCPKFFREDCKLEDFTCHLFLTKKHFAFHVFSCKDKQLRCKLDQGGIKKLAFHPIQGIPLCFTRGWVEREDRWMFMEQSSKTILDDIARMKD